MAHLSRLGLISLALLAGTLPVRASDTGRSRFQGTWVRETKDLRVIFDIRPVVIRCTVVTPHGLTMIMKADYILSKDGLLLGLTRSFRRSPKDEEDPFENRMVCLVLQATEKTLTVKEAKWQFIEGDGDDFKGTYKRISADKVSRKRKPSQNKTVRGMTLPSPRYLEHPPQYMPEGTTFPLPRELARMEEASQSGDAGKEYAVLTTMLDGLVDLLTDWGLLNRYSSDPQRRINELLNQSEDLRYFKDVDGRFWFTDQPSHMTYERIHGGIQ